MVWTLHFRFLVSDYHFHPLKLVPSLLAEVIFHPCPELLLAAHKSNSEFAKSLRHGCYVEVVDVLGGDRSVTAPRVPWHKHGPAANIQMTSHLVVQISANDMDLIWKVLCRRSLPKNSPLRHDLLNHEAGSVHVHKETEMDASMPKKAICKVTEEFAHKNLWVGACKKFDKKGCDEQKQCEWCVDTMFTKC